VSRCSVEFVIEPFTDGDPGKHVRAGIEAIEAQGLDVMMGPFGSTVEGDIDVVTSAISSMVKAAMSDGAHRVLVEVRKPS
jgi:uncharacterized protein YqgV (UPF0045/DUF77 family)